MSSYNDIINLPHHVSVKRPKMSMIDRAAQFSPFAALNGHGSAVEETARLTEKFAEPDEYEKSVINEKLRFLSSLCNPAAEFVYFEPDKKKDGGKYITASGTIKKIDSLERCVIMADGSRIPAERISDIRCELFGEMFL
ncbi:MAG: hypothetical protein J6R20_05350 [Clostridia bacterium]|nr:hypothetical protein [Clostridia bacterium]